MNFSPFNLLSGLVPGLSDLAGRGVPAHVPGVRPRHGLLLRAVPAWARWPPGQAKKNGPRAELTDLCCMPIYTPRWRLDAGEDREKEMD
jgi:hypothetical protein